MSAEETRMNVLPNLRMDTAAFLAWHRENDGRYELAGGRIVMMTGVSKAHIRIAKNLEAALESQLDPQRWEVFAELGLHVGPDTLRYPDIVIDRAGGAGDEYTATSPVLPVEVLSPSTAAIDLGDKAAEYLRIPSVLAYLVFSQDEPKAWIWVRAAGTFSPAAEIVAGTDAKIRVPALQLEFPLSRVYAGIRFG
jgi:Uma2 family endonuclease